MDDGEFSSFWPPSYRATYALRWIVEEGAVTGLSFIHEETGDRFDGRYEWPADADASRGDAVVAAIRGGGTAVFPICVLPSRLERWPAGQSTPAEGTSTY